MPTAETALAGRSTPIAVPARHYVNGASLKGPWPDGTRTALFAFGCFWGAEKDFWETPGVISTAVGYAGGFTPNPTYEEVCSGRTGHAESVLVAYDPARVSYEQLLKVFWEHHDPTQGMRQGNDVGHPVPLRDLHGGRRAAARSPRHRGMPTRASSPRPRYGEITTEITPRRRSTTPRTITSSTWPRIRTATARTIRPASVPGRVGRLCQRHFADQLRGLAVVSTASGYEPSTIALSAGCGRIR